MDTYGGNTVVNIYVDSRTLLRTMSKDLDKSMLEVLREALEQYHRVGQLSSSEQLDQFYDELAHIIVKRFKEDVEPKMFSIFTVKTKEEATHKPWLKRDNADDIGIDFADDAGGDVDSYGANEDLTGDNETADLELFEDEQQQRADEEAFDQDILSNEGGIE